MGTYSYGWEKLHLAVHALAGSSSQKQRLANAIAFNLIHIEPENDLPSDLRQDFSQFMDEITSVEANADKGNVQATINSLDETGVKRAIEKIISFYDTVCRHMEPN